MELDDYHCALSFTPCHICTYHQHFSLHICNFPIYVEALHN